MTPEQAYMIWKCTGRVDPAYLQEFRKRRAGELAVENLGRIVSEHSKKES